MDRLIQEFHADHKQIIEVLRGLHRAISNGDLPGMRSSLAHADRLLGPHCKWEEVFLYPALTGLIGEVAIQRLMTEHDGVHRTLRRMAELAQGGRWSEAERRAVHEHWSLLVEHTMNCDGLSRYIPLLPEDLQRQLADGLWAIRRQGVRLADYCRERRVA